MGITYQKLSLDIYSQHVTEELLLIVSTKLHIPHGRNLLVSRPRLMRKLNEGLNAKLTHISAQAGYGKTTALSEWVKQSSSMVAWVSLDKQDNEWIRFWQYLIASIQENIPGFGQAVETVIANGPTATLEHAMSALLNELYDLSHELVIILDDYHVIELPSIHQSLTYLIEHLPSRIHLYIASRTDLMIPTARLLAKGELHQVLIQDLRFQLEEGLAFFQDTTELSLTQEQVTELHDQTEGWISGLQLAAISLRRTDNIARTIQQFSGQQQHISDYLLEEVFYHLSEPIKSFLLETSILNRMNASLCQAVTGQMNGQEQLERLVQLNLFVIPLDDQRHWYRYHHLLSDFLQQILFNTQPDKWIEVHTRAAKWLEDLGFEEEAVEHYIEGRQAKDAVRLIEKNLHTLVQSKSVFLIRWVSALPEDSFAEKPMIELFYISVLLGVGEWTAAFRRVEQATLRFQALQETMNEAEWNQVMGNIYFFCSVTAYLRKDLERTSAYFELLEQHMPEGSFFQTMGRNRYQGYELFDDHLGFINDLHAADVFLLKWISIWEHKQEYPFVGCLYASYSKLLYEWNRLDEAEEYISQVLDRKDMEPFARTLIQIAVSASRIQQAKGNSHRASELLIQLKLKIKSPDYASFMLRIEAEQVCLSLQQGGALEEALGWEQRCGLTSTDEVSMNRIAEYLTLARVMAADGRADDALHLLERLQQLLIKEDALRDQIKVVIMQSVTLQRLGQTEAALLQLETALHLAEPEGYIRSFVDEGPLMAEMLTAYLKAQQANRLDSSSRQRRLLDLCQAVAPSAEGQSRGGDLT
jgi:LuxR family maltose regulon positive regulatory protein